MKRVLIFSLAYYPHVGGAEIAIKEVTDRISDIEFHLVTLRFSRTDVREERIGNVVVHRVGRGSGYFSKMLFIPLAALKARSLFRKEKFDACWAMMSYMLLPIVLLRVVGVRVPYVLTLQEGDPFEYVFNRMRVQLFSPLLSYGFRHAAVVQTISTFLGTWARARGFTGPLEVIPNGVDTKHFVGKKVAHDGTVLITTSRLVHKNAVDDIIRALALMPQQVRFMVLGVGPDEAMLKKLAADLGVATRVQFVGYVGHADLPKYLNACDIFVRPSRSEGMGNSFIEAMAAGLPVIATQEGGIADFLFDAVRNPDKESTGFAVDVDAPQQIADAVQNILRHGAHTTKVVENARALVFEKYDWDLIAKDMRTRVFDKVFK